MILNAQMISRGLDPNASLYTKFIRAHYQCGGYEEANRLMLEMKNLGLRRVNRSLKQEESKTAYLTVVECWIQLAQPVTGSLSTQTFGTDLFFLCFGVEGQPPLNQSTRMASVPQGTTSSWISSKEAAAPPVVPLLGSPGLRFLGVNSKSIDCKMLEGRFVSSRSSDGIGKRMCSLRRSFVRERRLLAITNSSPSNSGSTSEESSDKEKTPFGYTRKDVLLIGLGVTVLGVGLKSGLEFAGVDPLQAGNVVQLVLVLGLTVGWISTYIFRSRTRR
ncbi:hypothetical protein MLD38_012464 [Melastoma candidum]|uniref:Uncharacterized protein n=1 Tax=Melastoma candidum TaxID=119954 RepID=A0ACB9R6I5_9MYRT|nr:hypothetical protein MLD38_012464 [Melastoma candidum]